MKNKKNVIISIILILISIIYTILVKTIDVQSIGPELSSVGFATLNKYVFNLTGYNEIIYKITEVLGYIALLIAGIYGVIGLIQLIDRKSLLKVDKEILGLGILYIIVIGLYIIFDKVAINYRPVLMDGVLEPSYPSSHTMLSIVVCISSIMINKKLFKNIKLFKIENIISYILLFGIVIGRLISGVHWASDIIGSILISITLLMMLKIYYEAK